MSLNDELYRIWSGIAPDAMEAMEADGAEDADYLAETLLNVVDVHMDSAYAVEWHNTSSAKRMALALETVTS